MPMNRIWNNEGSQSPSGMPMAKLSPHPITASAVNGATASQPSTTSGNRAAIATSQGQGRAGIVRCSVNTAMIRLATTNSSRT